MRIGVDLGGTKIEACALSQDGVELARRRAATPREDYEATVAAIVGLVRDLERGCPDSGAKPATVGVGTPGSISSRTGRMKNCNSTWLNGRALGPDLERELGRPVRLANDANCFALSEATDGAARGARSVFGVILGTGVGGGIVLGREVWAGADGVAGEWGHNPLPWPRSDELPGASCYCGRRGCLETWLSGPALAADHLRETGRALDPPAIVAAAEAGDPEGLRTLERYVERLARGLAHVVNLLDPEVIVLGGGLSNAALLYRDLAERISAWIFSDRCAARIVANVHGDSSGVRGAAWLWPAT